MDKKVIIYEKSRVFDGFFKIDQALLSYERFDGEMSESVCRLNFERGDAVAAIIYHRETENVVLVNQFKYPTYERGPGWITETVAGILEENEIPEDAMRREILEEVGYEVESLKHISTFYVSPGGSSERIYLYMAEVSNTGKVADGGGLDEESEDIALVEIPVSELRNALASGEIQDAKTIIGIMWLQNYLKT